MPQSVYAVATMDTKGHELAFVAECLRAAGVSVTMVDVGVQSARRASSRTSIAPRWPAFIRRPRAEARRLRRATGRRRSAR